MAKKEESNDTYKYVIYGLIGAVVIGLVGYGVFWERYIRPFLVKRGVLKQLNGRSSFVPRPRIGSFSRPTKFQEATDALLPSRARQSLTSL